MKRKEITEQTFSIFRKVFGDVAHLSEQTSAEDIDNWDSLNHVILIQELEKAFGMKFDLFDIIEIRDVGGLVDYIFSKNSA